MSDEGPTRPASDAPPATEAAAPAQPPKPCEATSEASKPSEATRKATALRAALDDLVVRGAEVWDAPAVALVRTLLAKAEALGGTASEHLLKRAEARLEKLKSGFEDARERADQTYAQLARLGLDPAKRLDHALQYGRFEEVARAAKRHSEARTLARQAVVQPWLERLSLEARSRGLSEAPPAPHVSHAAGAAGATGAAQGSEGATSALHGDAPQASNTPPLTGAQGASSAGTLPSPDGSGRTLPGAAGTLTGYPAPKLSPLDLAAAIYRDAAADASTRMVIAQATSDLPQHAGRYHAPSVAARALEALDELAPAYLRVQVARLEAIGALERWVIPPPPKKPARASKKKPKKAAKASKKRVSKKPAAPKATGKKAPKSKPTDTQDAANAANTANTANTVRPTKADDVGQERGEFRADDQSVAAAE